ncbi:hypothetical protein QTP86_000633 [Hemibagrus guttatus]|nr:hypothetical protein QTP86_000633 [Hemibagrus guttatus]
MPFRGGLAGVFWIIVLLQNPSSLQLEVTNLPIYQFGKGYKAISKALGLPRTTVRVIIYKWRKHGTVENLPRSGRPTKITPRAQRQLIQEVTKDPITTSKELQASLASVKVQNLYGSKIKDRYVAQTAVTGAPPWSQAFGWGTQASAWWPSLCLWDSARHSPKERRRPAFP